MFRLSEIGYRLFLPDPDPDPAFGLKYITHPGSPIPDPGSWSAKATGFRILIHNTVCTYVALCYLSLYVLLYLVTYLHLLI